MRVHALFHDPCTSQVFGCCGIALQDLGLGAAEVWQLTARAYQTEQTLD